MARNVEDLANELAELTRRDRASLARALIDSLDAEPDAEVGKAWADEAERRYQAYCRGDMTASPAEQVFARVRDKPSK